MAKTKTVTCECGEMTGERCHGRGVWAVMARITVPIAGILPIRDPRHERKLES
jgi:hypothetical protein